MKVRVDKLSATSFEVTTAERALRVDVQPTELLLASVASCSAIDVKHILSRQKQPLEDLHVEIEGEQRAGYPASFRTMHLAFTAYGDALDDHKVERAVKLSVEKYCPVAKSLDPAIEVTWSVSVERSSR